ncbi:MAG: DUF3592 domain-containing protein [Lachnospiraceae bacterium]|nr:DUF3592 domain-containing protein [Lachnospiraceae bacterium]
MNKKKTKWKNLPSTFRTCIIGMILFLVIGCGLFLYGLLFNNISPDDIEMVQAEIISADKVSRNLSRSQEEVLRTKGVAEDSIKYEIKVEYRYLVDGKEYRYTGLEPYERADKLQVGGSEILRYAKVNGEPVINPESDSRYKVFGIIFVILGLLAGLAAFVLRPKKTKKS